MNHFFQTLTLGVVTFLLSATGAYSAEFVSGSFYARLIYKPTIQPEVYREQKIQPPIEVYNPPATMMEQNSYSATCADLFIKIN